MSMDKDRVSVDALLKETRFKSFVDVKEKVTWVLKELAEDVGETWFYVEKTWF